MAYRIEYDNSTRKYEVVQTNFLSFPFLLIVSYILFFLLTFTFWPEGKSFIQEVMIPGENAVTIGAWNMMTKELRAGADFDDAVYTFCCEIIDGKKNTN